MYLLDPSKKSFRQRNLVKLHSFTLVELMVVIAIIIILAAISLNAGNVVIRMAKKAKAYNLANQIQTACMAYYTDYSVYPIPPAQVTANPSADVAMLSTDKTDWQNLIWGLCGNLSPAFPSGGTAPSNPVLNTRAVPYLNLTLADVEHSSPPVASDSGIPLNPIYPTTAGVGTYFNIAFDGNYDGVLPSAAGAGSAANAITNFSLPTMPRMAITTPVAVWANCNYNTGTNNTSYVHTF